MATTRSPHAGGVLCPVMVGRDRELADLHEAWRAGGQVVVIRGSAGIGKSRLVRELASSARADGGTVLSGRCSPNGADVPFRPIREALLAAARTGLRPSAALEPFLPALGPLVPEWAKVHHGPAPTDAVTRDAGTRDAGTRDAGTRDAGTGDAGTRDAGSMVLAEGVLRLMVEWSAPQAPSLLLIEDVHWSDRETLDVVEYLADNLAGHPAVVIVTLREGETGPGRDLVDALLARRAVEPIDLGPLDPSQSEAMARACVTAIALPSDLIEGLVSRSDGVPFFIEELLATALGDSGSLYAVPAVPASVSAALDARLASLPDATGHFLRYAAVLGRQFDWHLVVSALRCPPEEALNRLRQATRTQLIDPDGAGFRFRHALTAEAVEASLLPEERREIALQLLRTLETLSPGLEGENCQLAARLAFDAGDNERACDLWLEAARRALEEGSLGSAEVLASRARGRRPLEADRILLSTWALVGQPLRALEAGHRILSSGAAGPSLQTEVRFDLVDAMIAAGRWEDANNFLGSLRTAPGLQRPERARRAIGEAELALGRNDKENALIFARAALADARGSGPGNAIPGLICRALWVIGRVERGRDTTAATAAFEEALDWASRHKLPVFRVKSLQELGTLEMFETLGTARLEEARRDALATGALATTAMVDLQLAAVYSCQGKAELTLATARRSEEVSRQFGLASLPMSVALQAVAHGFSGRQVEMEALLAEARATRGDSETVDMITLANGVALYHLGNGQLPEALDALDRAMDVMRVAGGGAHPFPGRWALLRTVLDQNGAEAREECRSLDFDTAMSRATLQAADAVAGGRAAAARRPGRARQGADAIFAAADRDLSRFEGGFLRSLAGLLVAPCAFADGWGEPVVWLREALANFEGLGLANFAGQCRSALREMGEPVPRRPRAEAVAVPDLLARWGVTPRETEVLAQLAARRSNRQIAEALHLSVRTVEKHVERLILKTGCTRPDLPGLADRAGLPPAV